jgi:DNA-binding CsgD family transcriptional regulator/tetratricopeptide (TPR) repeat protein
MRLIGRRAELARMCERLGPARLGEPGLVVIEGPAGIGKTTLLRAFLSGADDVRVLHATGEETESALSFGVLGQLFHGHAKAWSDPVTAGLDLIGLLGTAEEAAPVVLVLDDAHWADGPSLAALAFALRRLGAERVLCVVVVRDVAAVPARLGRLLTAAGTLRLPLGGLGPAELAELAEAAGGPALSERAAKSLHEHTGGNPLYCTALIAEVPGADLEEPGILLPPPRFYRLSVAQRLASCGVATRRLVEAASVLGSPCSTGDVADLAGLPDPLPPFEEAVGAGLLTEAPGLRITFPHPLVRASVYQDLPPGMRIRLHRRAADLSRDVFHRLNHRIRSAGRADPGLAAETAGYAREQAAAGRWSSAADLLLLATRLCGSARAAVRLRAEAAGALILDGRVAEARRVAEDLPAGAERSSALGQIAASEGRLPEAVTLLTEAWDGLDAGAVPHLATRVAHQMAVLCLMTAQGSLAAEWADRALSLRPGRADVDFTTYCGLTGLGISGQVREGLALTRGLPDPAIASLPELDGLLGRGLLLTCTDDLPGAVRILRGVVLAAQDRSVPFRLLARSMLGQAEFRAGLWDDALLHTETAATAGDDAGQGWLSPVCHALAALVPSARGDWDRAAEHIRRARDRITRCGLAGRAHTALAEAHLAAARADHAGVVAALEPLAAIGVHDIVHEPGVVPWHDLLVDALVSAGEHQQARAVLDPATKLAAACGRHSVLANLERAHGNLLAAEGTPRLAEAAYLAAADHASRVDLPFDRARLDLDHGMFLRRRGRRAAATARLEAARHAFERLGALPYLRRCVRELAACGHTTTAMPRAAIVGLTPQEHAVAMLVQAGLTNQQIAAELLVSVKTIEFHLRNAFAKARVASRAELAAGLRNR